ncbi:MAG: class I SAM-dependent methyltransferase, partial [Chloroflexi bacterium]|nr:class I SAM-dependent methyltransferase [Chloroflexota bacterium]
MALGHFGTIGLAETDVLSHGYDEIAEQTQMYPAFYRWVREGVASVHPRPGSRLMDMGCGTGRTLEEISKIGGLDLSGVDFSAECVRIARGRMPGANIRQHDLVSGPPGEKYDIVLMSEVVEHLLDPASALRHVRASLVPGGKFILTFPNRLAFWPMYRIGPLADRLPAGRARHWFRWFTMPCEMWSHQPIDHAYATYDIRELLEGAGFRVLDERGLRLWP